jgi:hypothetical protein
VGHASTGEAEVKRVSPEDFIEGNL